jgi:hypothetical protein
MNFNKFRLRNKNSLEYPPLEHNYDALNNIQF